MRGTAASYSGMKNAIGAPLDAYLDSLENEGYLSVNNANMQFDDGDYADFDVIAGRTGTDLEDGTNAEGAGKVLLFEQGAPVSFETTDTTLIFGVQNPCYLERDVYNNNSIARPLSSAGARVGAFQAAVSRMQDGSLILVMSLGCIVKNFDAGRCGYLVLCYDGSGATAYSAFQLDDSGEGSGTPFAQSLDYVPSSAALPTNDLIALAPLAIGSAVSPDLFVITSAPNGVIPNVPFVLNNQRYVPISGNIAARMTGSDVSGQ